jgi:hypothetical protein
VLNASGQLWAEGYLDDDGRRADGCRRAWHDPPVTARVGPIDRQVVELAERIGKPPALVAVAVDEEERAGRVVRAQDRTLALDPARLSPQLTEALRRLELPE